tara:strand:+ start:321 stop:1127 length:807 start_codon:yes stop_codon:yes gene_type:complete
MLLENKVFIVTGASSGIGEELSKQLSKEGAKVVCAARTEAKLKKISEKINSSGGHSIYIQTDITILEQCQNLIDRTIEDFGQIDGLILNAGISMWAKFDEITDPGFFSELMKTNYLGSVNCCFAAIPFLKKSNGKIISCSTAQAIMGFPNHSGYVASKHALHGFLETISMENKGEITILEAVLSWIRGTNLRGNSFRADGKKHKDEYRKHTNQSVSLESCVGSIIDGIKKEKKTIYIPKKLGLIPFLNTFFKNFLQKKVIREINKNKN